MTRDHKLEDPDEAKAIISANGRIDSYRDKDGGRVGPLRVWLQHENVPGLAMSRSFGDSTACQAGVHAIPEINVYELTPTDKILVLASDGVWEYLSNSTVANIVEPYH